MFQSVLKIEPFPKKIQYCDKLFFIGSCFSNEISQKFSLYKFNVISNPFGTLYNPVSIYSIIERIVSKKFVSENDFFLDDDIYKSFDFHSSLAGINLSNLIFQTNQLIEQSYSFLKEARWIFITYGTSHIHEHISSKKVVANCHKRPSYEFINRLLNFDEAFNYIEKTINIIKQFNPEIQVVFTISPVRYLKYGAFENQVSKSLLFVCLNELKRKYTEILYFPAYEIFLDELRDYRFYATDLIHPSNVGIDYVWNKLIEASFSEQTLNLKKQVQYIINSCQHRPMFPESKTYTLFKKSLLEKIEILEKQYPFLNFEREKMLI